MGAGRLRPTRPLAGGPVAARSRPGRNDTPTGDVPEDPNRAGGLRDDNDEDTCPAEV